MFGGSTAPQQCSSLQRFPPHAHPLQAYNHVELQSGALNIGYTVCKAFGDPDETYLAAGKKSVHKVQQNEAKV